MPTGSELPKVLLIGVGSAAAAAACCRAMFGSLLSSTAGKPTMPPESRKQKLTEAENTFGDMFPKLPSMSVLEAHKLLQEQPEQYVLVDVRNSEEQKVSMIAGNRVLTTAEYEQQRKALKDATAICYCTVGYRSSQYAASLMDKGCKAVNLQGGIVGWTHEGLPLVDGSNRQQPSSKVHTYAQQWAYQADGYEPVYYKYSNFVMVRDFLGSLKGAFTGG